MAELKINGKKLTITVDLEGDRGISSSGKSRIIETLSEGFMVDGKRIKVGVNVYEPIKTA